jgi:chromate transporter
MRACELFWRFTLISLLAFGGGAGIPLIERIAVRETGWIDDREFTAAIASSQVVPGPAMVIATFIGYRVAGLVGALAATVGVFLMPSLMAAVAARQIERGPRHRRIEGFRRGASAAAVGLFGVTALSLARPALGGWTSMAMAAAAFALALGTRVHPIWILLGGALLGIITGSPPPGLPAAGIAAG